MNVENEQERKTEMQLHVRTSRDSENRFKEAKGSTVDRKQAGRARRQRREHDHGAGRRAAESAVNSRNFVQRYQNALNSSIITRVRK